ncbi:MAG: Hsp70 family protein [Treponema sp.]|nr:Hsp70 family protein [Treponema sp.]MCL2250676.1 Hsp70 family protein [Treponema sp.]
MGINVGIDLGTTYSAVAVYSNESGELKILKNSDDKNYTPSVTHIENGKVRIGDEAKQLQGSGDLNAASFYKSMMGEKGYTLYLDGKEYSPEALSGLYLKELIKDVSQHNNVKIDGAVITCPAYFNESQRLATENAGNAAGIKVLKLINEPTAAIIAYGLTGDKKKNVMVYDLGGGTFDVTIAEVDGTKVKVLTTNGNHQLGGKDWDAVIADDLKRKFFDEFSVNLEDNSEDYYQLKVQCEDIKKRLTSMSSTTAVVQSQGYTGKYEITREFFDSATYSLLNETSLLIDRCFSELGKERKTNFSWKDVDEVVLVGGSTRMLQVKEFVRREFGREPVTKNIDVDTIVAAGAAMQAQLCVENKLVLGGSGSRAASGGGSAKQRLVITGDAIQDITSHSLGMLAFTKDETNFINSIIIKKNSPLNTPFGKDYTFSGDNLDVYVLQGESSEPRDCTLLYKYCVKGFSRGIKSEFKLNFIYDKDGVVDVKVDSKDGSRLTVEKSVINESIEDLINRLIRENEERKRLAREFEVMFMVDTSGSMEGQPLKEAMKACKDFVAQIDLTFAKVSIVDFADTSKFACKSENNSRTIEKAISSLGSNGCGGSTSASPLSDCGDKFSSERGNQIIIVLTDGVWDKQSKEQQAAQKLKNSDKKIYAIGLGDADLAFLCSIASDASNAHKVDLNKLSQTFLDIAGSIATEK